MKFMYISGIRIIEVTAIAVLYRHGKPQDPVYQMVSTVYSFAVERG
jgi:hypothetical protein